MDSSVDSSTMTQNYLTIKRMYHLFLITFIGCNFYNLCMKSKFYGVPPILSLIAICTFMIKVVICAFLMDDPLYLCEYIVVSSLALFHYFHMRTLQKNFPLLVYSIEYEKDKLNRLFYKFYKNHTIQYFKMLSCLNVIGIVAISHLKHHIQHGYHSSHEYNLTRMLYSLPFFIIIDLIVYYPLILIKLSTLEFSDHVINMMLNNLKMEFNIMKQYHKIIVRTTTIALLFISICYGIPKINPHVDTLWNFVSPFLKEQCHYILSIITLVALFMWIDISIRQSFSGSIIDLYHDEKDSTTDDQPFDIITMETNINVENDQNNVFFWENEKKNHFNHDCIEPFAELIEHDENGEQILSDLMQGIIKPYNLEHITNSNGKAILFRRIYMSQWCNKKAISTIPCSNYPFDIVHQQCCENVIGYITIPLGLAGPCVVNNKKFWIPLATTEGCLVASINRGFSAIRRSGGIYSYIVDDGMTRSPVLQANSALDCINLKNWLRRHSNITSVKNVFDSTSRYAKLVSINCTIVGKLIYLRFKATTGDAMGMNMVSKAVEASTDFITNMFPSFKVISLSGNYCSDKKAAAINWICGRGKSVTSEAIITLDVVKNVLKVDNIDHLVGLNLKKNLVGSALSGSIGGFNAHASNSVAAIFAATGQDLGQIIESSNCMTIIDKTVDGSLYISCTMPSLEVGTVGGGTILPTQQACLEIMNVYESDIGSPSESLAMLICATVLAGELSLLSSLCEGTLVKSHLKHNRSQTSISSVSSKSCKISNKMHKSKNDVDNPIKNVVASFNIPHNNPCPML